MLKPQQPEAHKAHAPLPVGIQLTAQAAEAHGESLQASHQHVDRHHQEQPIDTLRVAQATALQLEDPRFLVAEQLLAAELPGVTPDQIQWGMALLTNGMRPVLLQRFSEMCPSARPRSLMLAQHQGSDTAGQSQPVRFWNAVSRGGNPKRSLHEMRTEITPTLRVLRD